MLDPADYSNTVCPTSGVQIRKPKHTLNWGSQTTITEPVSVWKQILVNAAQEKKWFRDLLEDVMIELKK